MKPTARSRVVSRSISTILKVKFGYGFWLIDRTRQFDLILTYPRTSLHWVRLDEWIRRKFLCSSSTAVEVIRNNMAVRQQNDLRLYLDVIPDPTEVGNLQYAWSIYYTIINIVFSPKFRKALSWSSSNTSIPRSSHYLGLARCMRFAVVKLETSSLKSMNACVGHLEHLSNYTR